MRPRTLLLAGVIGIGMVAVACGSDESSSEQPALLQPTSTPAASAPTSTSVLAVPRATAPTASAPGPPADGAGPSDEQIAEYVAAAERSINLIGQTARLVSGVGIRLSLSDDAPVDTGDIVRAAVDSSRLALDSLNESDVPPGLVPLHEAITNAVALYVQASETLRPASERSEFDYFGFQNLFHQGGASYHSAGAL